jgi:hypothetical protein
MPGQDWLRWRLVWDRTPADWRAETITWFMGDQQFHQISGGLIGDQGVWNSLAASPMYFLLNMAVGGNWVSNKFCLLGSERISSSALFPYAI